MVQITATTTEALETEKKVNRLLINLKLRWRIKDACRNCHHDIKFPWRMLARGYYLTMQLQSGKLKKTMGASIRMRPRSEQSDNDLAAKAAGFTAAFEKQVAAFNTLTHKRKAGEFRAEERLMIEQALLQDESQALLEVQIGMESRKKAAEAKMRTAAMVQSQKAHAESQFHAEMFARVAMRTNTVVFQAGEGSGGHDMDEMNHERGSEQREEEVPLEDFLNDEKQPENDETGIQGK